MPIPLPPVQEQHRIITKVDELMTLCDLLEARLNIAQKTQDTIGRLYSAKSGGVG